MSSRTFPVLDRIATVSVILVSAVFLYAQVISPLVRGQSKGPALPSAPISLKGAHVLGDPHAAFAILEFSDFQCPYCADFVRATLPKLKTNYVDTGKMLIAFKHLPLPIHRLAVKAAVGAECAGSQGRFWEMHDLLFVSPPRVDDDIASAAAHLSLDMDSFSKCQSTGGTSTVEADRKEAEGLGFSTTPLFLIGQATPDGAVRAKVLMVGAQPFEDFQKSIDAVMR